VIYRLKFFADDERSASSAQAISLQPSAFCQRHADGKYRTTGSGCLGWSQNRRGAQRNGDIVVQMDADSTGIHIDVHRRSSAAQLNLHC
jgi:hypothetical protein